MRWLQLDVDIFNDSKIKIIRTFPAGNDIFILWIGLLCLAMKSKEPGYISLSDNIPYDYETLSTELGIDVKTVELGLKILEKYQMIHIMDDKIIEIINFTKHQSIEKIEFYREKNREKQRKFRENRKNLALSNGYVTVTKQLHDGNVTEELPLRDGNITVSNGIRRRVEKEKKKEKEEVKEENKKEVTTATTVENIFSLYENFIGTFDGYMAETLKAAEKEFTREQIEYAFQEAREKNARNWKFINAVLERLKRDGIVIPSKDHNSKSNGSKPEFQERKFKMML